MEKLKINTVYNSKLDRVLNYCGAEYNITPELVEYVGPFKKWDGITLFVDECFDLENIHIIDEIESTIKIGWFHEPRMLHGVGGCMDVRYSNAEKIMDKFDYFFTYDHILLDKFPDKAIYVVDNAIYLPHDKIKLYEKSKLMSMIYSFKQWTPGHRLRHQLAKMVDGLELFGSGTGKHLKSKDIGLADFMFSIVIENNRTEKYFTEKILDCFATGTIPIYWGCPNIGDYFNEKGIMSFEKIEDLPELFSKLEDPEYYNQLLPYVKENYKKVQEYRIYEDWMYNNVYKKILNL